MYNLSKALLCVANCKMFAGLNLTKLPCKDFFTNLYNSYDAETF